MRWRSANSERVFSGAMRHRAWRHRRQRRNVFEAVDARHFLDQVFLDLDVEAIGRRASPRTARRLRERQAQAREDVGDRLRRVNGTPITFCGARGAQHDRLRAAAG